MSGRTSHTIGKMDRELAGVDPQLNVVRSLMARVLLVILGLLFLAIGILGYLVPGLPGTLFLLIAAWLFSLSHPRLYNWMMTNRWFGTTLRDYRAGLGIPLRIKVIAVTAIATSVTASVVFAIDDPWVRTGLIALGLYGMYFVLSRPTRQLVREGRSAATSA